MNNPQFSVLYNGHPVAITTLGADTYMAQVTYKPMQLQLKENFDGTKKWIDVETQQETYVTSELGRLITSHYHSAEHVQLSENSYQKTSGRLHKWPIYFMMPHNYYLYRYWARGATEKCLKTDTQYFHAAANQGDIPDGISFELLQENPFNGKNLIFY